MVQSLKIKAIQTKIMQRGFNALYMYKKMKKMKDKVIGFILDFQHCPSKQQTSSIKNLLFSSTLLHQTRGPLEIKRITYLITCGGHRNPIK